MQIDLYENEAAAWSDWHHLLKQHPDAFDGLTPKVVERDWVYTLIAIPEQGEAQERCEGLRQVGQQCFVTSARLQDANPIEALEEPGPNEGGRQATPVTESVASLEDTQTEADPAPPPAQTQDVSSPSTAGEQLPTPSPDPLPGRAQVGVLQIAALPSRVGALSEVERLSGMLAPVLERHGSVALSVLRRGRFYLVVARSDEPEKLCNALRQVGQDCFQISDLASAELAEPSLPFGESPEPSAEPASTMDAEEAAAAEPTATPGPRPEQIPGMQLALYLDQAHAEEGWRLLSSRFGDLLRQAVPVFEPVDGFVALRAITPRPNESERLCAALRQRGAECLPAVVRPPPALLQLTDAESPPAQPSASENPDFRGRRDDTDDPQAEPAAEAGGEPSVPSPAGEEPVEAEEQAAEAARLNRPAPRPRGFKHGGVTTDYGSSPLGPDSIVISIADRKLLYEATDGHVYVWPVAVGRHRSYDILGDTEIMVKRSRPTWTPPPDMRKRNPRLPSSMGPGPNNPLGAYALNLGFPYIRIHGTNKPGSVGRASSSGCYRMHADAIEFLFKAVTVGTPVRVTREPLGALIQMTANE